MKAAGVHDFTQNLRLADVAKPVPARGAWGGAGCIETSDLCHTDIHAAHGDWPVKPTLPLIPGHEGVGIVEELGAGVERLKIGDRVAMPWLGSACGVCEYCIDGWETLCKKQVNTGYGRNGSYAEYVTANAAYVAAVPDEVDPLDAAPLTCAGVTTYKAVKVSGARSGQLVAVFGIGGLGHLALQYAKIAGASVVAVDVSDEKLSLAKDLGVDYVVNALIDDPIAAIGALGGAHAAITTAVAPRIFGQAFGSLRRGGTLVLVRAARRQHGHPADLPDRAERADRGGVDRRNPAGYR
jgi:propanol-preferring alcohol dehydrogenase